LSLGLGAAAGRDDRPGDLLDRRRVLASIAAVKPHDWTIDLGKLEVSHIVESQRSPHGVLGRLHLSVVTGSPSVVLELDPSGKSAFRHGHGVLRIEATQLQALGQDEHVRREAVAPLVGREPELVLRDMPYERAIHGGATKRAASVAAPVTADENK